jgi:hypothetical protein
VRFREVRPGRCSGGHIIWEVVYHDGTEDRFHHGRLGGLTDQQREQLIEAAREYIEVEHRRKWTF